MLSSLPSFLRRLTRPDGAQVEYHYDPLGRRLAKVGAEGVVFYGWDGDTLAFETRSTGAIHYLFEPASFTPLAQVHTAPIEGLRVPAWGAHIPYDPEADPLRAPPPEPEPPRAIFYYHTDHLGTPQLLTDAAGQQALEMEYQAWAPPAKSSPKPPKARACATRYVFRGNTTTTNRACTTTATATMIQTPAASSPATR